MGKIHPHMTNVLILSPLWVDVLLVTGKHLCKAFFVAAFCFSRHFIKWSLSQKKWVLLLKSVWRLHSKAVGGFKDKYSYFGKREEKKSNIFDLKNNNNNNNPN